MAYQPMVTPKPLPSLHIPQSNNIVKVSIIDTTTSITLPMGVMVKPVVIGGYETCTCPSYSFLIEHPSGRKLLFDLGVRKDWENMAPFMVDILKKNNWAVTVGKDVHDILEENGHDPKAVEAIFWSHFHWDHQGDPSRFPGSTALVVGPGFKARFPQAWPTIERTSLREDSWEGRELREVEFKTDLKIGRFKAFDWFGDGSFYVLDTHGHTVEHICGLARTTPDTFILMGGDAAHHAGEIRPTEYVPLPSSISLEGLKPSTVFPLPCPGELLVQHVHPKKSAIKPFYEAADGFNEDSPAADWTIEGIEEFDAHENVLVVLSHDASLLDIVGFYPQNANDWKQKLWLKYGRWRFLTDFAGGLSTVGGKL